MRGKQTNGDRNLRTIDGEETWFITSGFASSGSHLLAERAVSAIVDYWRFVQDGGDIVVACRMRIQLEQCFCILHSSSK
ncbi:hypothetical protein Hanom_Chr12g01136961 [Helianthus anomalus]